ncbi:hypothetical protein DL765_002727 [Monosporascus sp. GIB2]|nr:hypothetical protein DL765_002727 [Monosporascus sp. GIB2]
MAEILGATASAVALAGTACTLIQETRKARDRVRGTSQTLDEISQQLTALERSVRPVEEKAALQTAAVEQQVAAITGVAAELKSLFGKLATDQQRRPMTQLARAVRFGDKDERELRGILDRLDRARDEFVLRASVAQVGLVGNLQDGFHVAFDVLQETNEKVKQVLDIHLALLVRLRDRASQQRGTYGGMIPLNADDVEELGLGETRDATRDAATSTNETSIYSNVTLGQARIMTGNVGIADWQRVAGQRTTIAHNRFGQDVRIMTGDQGGEVAARFNENFW